MKNEKMTKKKKKEKEKEKKLGGEDNFIRSDDAAWTHSSRQDQEEACLEDQGLFGSCLGGDCYQGRA